MIVIARDVKKGFGRTDGKFVVWRATADAEPAQVPGRVKIAVEFADGKPGFKFPESGDEIEGVYVIRGRP